MLPLVEKLLVLQDRDQKIKSHKAAEKALPAERAAVEAKRKAARDACDKVRESLKANELERRKLQGDAQTKRDAIGRYRAQQNLTRKNEEFQALVHEITRAEADVSAIEDRELELMEAAESLTVQVKEAEAELARALKTCDEQDKALEEKVRNLAGRLDGLVTERAAAAQGLDEDVIYIYERVFKNKGDAAIVALEHEICQGCHMKVPGVTASEVKAERSLVQCPNCSRILYRNYL
ncbi:MAG: hypothetical protein JSR82_00345 [Verrucomicrobia bacterium]|nr:hypothetical protein [Verrucomicrobiota bacterium]